MSDKTGTQLNILMPLNIYFLFFYNLQTCWIKYVDEEIRFVVSANAWHWLHLTTLDTPNTHMMEYQPGKLALANASENLAGRVENRPGQVEFFIGYIRDYPVRASAKKC